MGNVGDTGDESRKLHIWTINYMSFALLLLGIWVQATWAYYFHDPWKANAITSISTHWEFKLAVLFWSNFHIWSLFLATSNWTGFSPFTSSIRSLLRIFETHYHMSFSMPSFPFSFSHHCSSSPPFKTALIHSFIHSLSIHYAGKTTVTKRSKSLPSWNLHSSGGYRRQLTNR